MNKGKFIVFLGTDGVGKSSITNLLKKICEDEKKELIIEHWRPNLLPPLRKNKEIYTDANDNLIPNKKVGLKNKLFSLLRYIYYTLDFFVGYQLKVKKQINKGNIFIIERYFFDNMINPLRYKFYFPFLDKIIYKLIKKPDILVLLTCDSNVAYERKKELTVEELTKNQKDYLQFLNSYGFIKCTFDTTTNKSSDIAYEIKRRINL
ncbi:nucleoside/nucleotide kinase family protein [Neobacillus jeddahensis]|uniref:deoxynucleoside kinase n=1 Tax=Neobacillus jeddahensis TaxID=1461580 RepID=UPI00058B29BF|nr:deoxynucleoside kinase [Neobacillus jeddahensis]